MNRDVVLLTVDSWRADTTQLLTNLPERLPGKSEAICAGAATNWVFPAILSSSYYPQAYNEVGNLRSDITSLPRLLSDAGFNTAGFVACNPYVSKWDAHFDTFWNGGIVSDSEQWYSNAIERWLSRGYRTAFLKKRVSAAEIAQRASTWYAQQDGPKFLWMHLMEPHLPYYPGIRKASEIGLLDTYRSILNYQRHGDKTSSHHMSVQRELYNKTVERFDDFIPDLIDFIDEDAISVVAADHGEEFDHGHYDHERLYDECVRVPLFYNNVPDFASVDTVRQIDFAPAILSQLNIEVPDDWDGQPPKSLETQAAIMVTPQPDAGLLHTGIRTKNQKLIKSFDKNSGQLVQTEFYDLNSDSDERNNIYNHGIDTSMENRLDEFISKHETALSINAVTESNSDLVESRLQDLGYK
jgi:arylsulfatase A-like enzyme